MIFTVLLTLVAFLYILFDVHYFIRGYLGRILAPIRKKFWPKKLLDEVVRYGVFTTTDLGFWWMMAPARFLRECDFARFDMWDDNSGFDAMVRLGGGIRCGGLAVTYMMPLKLFDTYLLKTRVVCWDETAFFIEHRFERRRDHVTSAVVYVSMPLWNVTPAQVVKEMTGKHTASPVMPQPVWALSRCNNATSEDINKNK